MEQKTADYLKKSAQNNDNGALTAQIAALKTQLNQLSEEKNVLSAQKQALEKERPALLEAKEEKLRLSAERDRLNAEKETIVHEKDAVFAEMKQKYESEIATLTSKNISYFEQLKQYEDMQAAFERGKNESVALRDSLDAALKEKESLSIEADGLRRAYEELKSTAAQVSAKLDATVAELKTLRGEE